jgi:glutaminase
MKLGSLLGVDTMGPVTSAISVFAPMVSDIGNSMMGMRLVYDFHKHPTTRGPTGTPFTLM